MGKGFTDRLLLRRVGMAVATAGGLTVALTSLFVGSTGAPALAVTACTTPSATGLHKSINTDQGCDIADGTANYPITGFISDIGATASTTYTLEDVYQTLPESSGVVYPGAYSLALTCTTGSGTNGSYTVAAGTATYPTPPSPAPTGTEATLTTNASGDAIC